MKQFLLFILAAMLLVSCKKEMFQDSVASEPESQAGQSLTKRVDSVEVFNSDIDGILEIIHNPCSGEDVSLFYEASYTTKVIHIGARYLYTFTYHFWDFRAEGMESGTPYTVSFTSGYRGVVTVTGSTSEVQYAKFVLTGPDGHSFSWTRRARFSSDPNGQPVTIFNNYVENCR